MRTAQVIPADGAAGAGEASPATGGVPPRRWTINGDFLGLKATGVARFAHEVTAALDALVAEAHPLTRDLALDIVAPVAARAAAPLHHLPVRVVPELRPRLPQVWVQFQLPRHVPGGLVSFCNLAPLRVDRHITCIHDAQTRSTPDSYGMLFRLAHRLILPRLGQRADITTTVSEFSKRNLVALGIAPRDTLVVVHNGSDHAGRWNAPAGGGPWRRGRPFVLCLGRNEAHKNMRLVWRLAAPLDRLGLDIVVAGDFDPSRFDGPAGRPANIRCLGRVSDDELAGGFAEALAFLFPSRTEGFGLPAVEAMSRGCPVVASSAPSLPDTCGPAALFADCDDVAAWVEAVAGLMNSPAQRQAMVEAGRARARCFTWRATALAYLELMRLVDRRRSTDARKLDAAPSRPGDQAWRLPSPT